jgi:hypothetical protein
MTADDTPSPEQQPRGTIEMTLQRLAGYRVTAAPIGEKGLTSLRFAAGPAEVTLLDDRAAIRQLLTDAIAQLDALDAQGNW